MPIYANHASDYAFCMLLIVHTHGLNFILHKPIIVMRIDIHYASLYAYDYTFNLNFILFVCTYVV